MRDVTKLHIEVIPGGRGGADRDRSTEHAGGSVKVGSKVELQQRLQLMQVQELQGRADARAANNAGAARVNIYARLAQLMELRKTFLSLGDAKLVEDCTADIDLLKLKLTLVATGSCTPTGGTPRSASATPSQSVREQLVDVSTVLFSPHSE